MPFTLAHPAILIPFFRKKLPLSVTGMVIGSMVPDFEFFFRLRVTENIGHHGIGILLLDIPLALLLCFLFHNIFRNPFINHLPAAYIARTAKYKSFNWNEYFRKHSIVVLLSILIGVLSHFFLDGFTHFDGFVVRAFPVFSYKLPIMSFNIPVYGLLQALFSLIGLVLLYWRIILLPQSNERPLNYSNNLVFWSLLTIVSFSILIVRMLLMPMYHTFWDIVIAIIGSFIYASLAISLVYKQMDEMVMQD